MSSPTERKYSHSHLLDFVTFGGFAVASAELFTSIEPSAAAICATTAVLTYKVSKPLFEKIITSIGYDAPDQSIKKKWAYANSIAAGWIIPNLVGFRFSLADTANLGFLTSTTIVASALTYNYIKERW